VRYNPDQTEQERFVVPIAYATKELYVQRLENDYNLDKKVQITLPRFSFEMTGLTYDASRKQNTNIRNFAQSAGGAISQYNPVPYDFDFSLYLYVRNIEDATQALEHIIPYFTPDYTIKVNMIPEMGIIKEVPVVLKDTTQEIVYEGDKNSETRLIIWTLNFTVKGFIFGSTTNVGLITHSITNVYNKFTASQEVQFTMDSLTGVGNYKIGETVYQGYSPGTASATGTVVYWYNNILVLNNINGNFISNLPIRSTSTSTNYIFTNYTLNPKKLVQRDNYVNPANATIDGPWTANTIIQQF
jgi:hypothetical protein